MDCCPLQIKEAVSYQTELQYPPPRLRPLPVQPLPTEPRAQSFRPGMRVILQHACKWRSFLM